jgi:hypothetical protein
VRIFISLVYLDSCKLSPGKKESDALELVDDWKVIAICEDVPVRQEAIKKQFFNIIIFFARRGDQVHESANPCLT